jgi:hypothetical protein
MKSFIVFLFFISNNVFANADSISAWKFNEIAAFTKAVGNCSVQSRYVPDMPCGRGDRCGDEVSLSIEYNNLRFNVGFFETKSYSSINIDGLNEVSFNIKDELIQRSCTTITFPEYREDCRLIANTMNKNILTIRFDDQKIQSLILSFDGDEQHPRSYTEFKCAESGSEL